MVTYVGPSPDGFMSGLDLSEAFFVEAVEPIMRRRFPGLRFAAARIGPGSDVLGFPPPRLEIEASLAHGGGSARPSNPKRSSASAFSLP
jgi:hypothetical protein